MVCLFFVSAVDIHTALFRCERGSGTCSFLLVKHSVMSAMNYV